MASELKWADGKPVYAESELKWADGSVYPYWYEAAVPPSGLSIPIAMHHYQQQQ